MATESDVAWPLTVGMADSAFAHQVYNSAIKFLEVPAESDYRNCSELQDRLQSFVTSHWRGGNILVKTSTVGQRHPCNEASTILLNLILETLCDLTKPSCIVLADGPAYTSYADECQRLGWSEIAHRLGTSVVDLGRDQAEAKILGFPISSTFLNSDLVVNVAKVKTHKRFGVSLGYKSLLGTVVHSSPGKPKFEGRHRLVPILLHSVAQVSPPALTVLDGWKGVEGEGPMCGSPTSSQFLLFGDGFLGPDIQCAIEMGFDPILVPGFLTPLSTPPSTSVTTFVLCRHSRTDFRPSLSCAWLYQSLRATRSRIARFNNLNAAAIENWRRITGHDWGRWR